ncbi:MAG: 50S ribosomal protein L29 [Coriobacteriia bacterium]|nr:50S ribosomal protein L29 [Coriobacteriia bacterium]
MKAVEVHEMEDSELGLKLKETRTELFNLRFRLATGQLDNPARIKDVKKDIARLQTEIRAREIRAAQEAQAS